MTRGSPLPELPVRPALPFLAGVSCRRGKIPHLRDTQQAGISPAGRGPVSAR